MCIRDSINIAFSFQPSVEAEGGKDQYMSWGPFIMAVEDGENAWLKEFKSVEYQGSIDIIDCLLYTSRCV